MERTVDKSDLEVFYGEAGKNTVLHSGLETFLDRGNKFLGNVTALNLVYKLKIAFEAFVNGLYAYNDVGKFTTTTADGR